MDGDEQELPVERRPAGTLTVHQLLTLAHGKIDELTREGLNIKGSGEQFASSAGAIISAARNREFSIAKTAIEDARLRVRVGIERSHGIVRDADLQVPKVLKAAKRAFEDEQDEDS
jgi:hypothetical protein